MSSALRVILGVSLLASIGCDNAGDADDTGTGGLKPVAGTTSTAGSGVSGSGTGGSSGGSDSNGGSSGSGMNAAGVPLTAVDGWVDGMGNTLGIQGALFAYADDTSKMDMVDNSKLTPACISGTAAEVVLTCTPEPPAMDCYGHFWGAAMGLNLNQPIDEATGEGATPMAFDAGAKGITGFAFEITGDVVPSNLRFKVEDDSGEFCNTSMKPIMKGENVFKFSDLHAECWEPKASMENPNAEGAKGGLIKIAWQVPTKTGTSTPFNYCVGNIRALTD